MDPSCKALQYWENVLCFVFDSQSTDAMKLTKCNAYRLLNQVVENEVLVANVQQPSAAIFANPYFHGVQLVPLALISKC